MTYTMEKHWDYDSSIEAHSQNIERVKAAIVDLTANPDVDKNRLRSLNHELNCWRSGLDRLTLYRPDTDDSEYMIVPRKPSDLALRRADGYTDLVDASGDSRTHEGRRREIELAIRLAVETDGVPFGGDINGENASLDTAAADEAIKRKNLRAEIFNLTNALHLAIARYRLLMSDLERHTDLAEIAELVGKHRQLSEIDFVPAVSINAEEVDKWANSLNSFRTAGQ